MKNQATLVQNTVFTENNKRLPLYPSRLILLVLLCALATGLLPQNILSIVILGASLLLVGTKQIYLVFPVMLFYYSPFGLLAGMSVYRFFTIIFLLIALAEAKTFRLHKSYILPFFLFTVYCIVVLSPDGARRAVFAILDIFCVLILIQHYLQKPENLRRFFAVYALVALFSFVTGLVLGGNEGNTIIINGEIVQLIRYTATFEDPNYMGFFFTIAVFSLLALKLFHPKFRTLLIIALYAMMLSTLSITMIVVNTILWVIYLWIAKKLNLKTLIVVLLILAILFGLYTIGLNNPDTPILGTLAFRISEKLTSLFEDDLNSVTTGRTNLTLKHWRHFTEQSFLKMLIGMNAASPLKVGGGLDDVAHNEYVDLLLNIGILGTLVYLGFLFLRCVRLLKNYIQNKNRDDLCLFMVKCVWLLYAMTLTVFGDFRFSFFFFL